MISKFNKYNFLKENLDILNESTEFADQQLGLLSNPLGPSYGFATDKTMSIYSDDSGAYVDNYARTSQIMADLGRTNKNLNLFISGDMKQKFDTFLDDIEEYQNLKILRIFINQNLGIDIFISFDFMEEEFFGVFRNFNGINKPRFDSDLLSDPRFCYINKEYYIKLNNYLYKILFNWFIPTPGDYLALGDLIAKNVLGDNITIPKNSSIYIKGYNTNQNNEPYLIIKYKNEMYKIVKNDYYFFK
jgi:hypothetical protein